MPEDQHDLSKLTIKRDPAGRGSAPHTTRRRLYISAAILILVALTAFITLKSMSVEEVDAATVVQVSPAQGSTLLTASGYVVAQRKAAIASKATGRLIKLDFKEGDKVRKGQVIALIESADVEAALAQAKADLAVAVADSVDAARNLDRSEVLFRHQLISQADLDAAKAQYDRTKATIASREASENAAEVAVENTRIRAPFDGTILTKNADVGEVVAPFGAGASSKVAVVTIADMSSVEVEADVSEANIERIRTGQPCEVTLDAYPDVQYRAVVDKIVPTADRAKATVLTKVRFLRLDQRILPEMSAKVHFLSQQIPDSVDLTSKLAVDPAAIVTRNGQTVAFVLRGDTAVERTVQTNGSVGTLTGVASGLSAGDRAVMHPPDNLRSGDRVKIRQH